MTYKLINDKDGNLMNIRKVVGEQIIFIPVSQANTDYQQYLKWLEDGNTPEPAEEQQ